MRYPQAMTMLNPGGRASSEHYRFLLDLAIAINNAGTIAAFGHLDADYTLTSTTSAQKLFNWSPSGAVALDAGVYQFNLHARLTGMSATSGNAFISVIGAGTATVTPALMRAIGVDENTPNQPYPAVHSASTDLNSRNPIFTATVGTGIYAGMDGLFRVTVPGTLIPSISLTTAAAAVVTAGSFFIARRIGDGGTIGNWS